jgi:hypothetical protein
MVLGRIAGWSPPVQLTITQLAVLIASFLVLVWTWPLWAPPLPDGAAAATMAGGPIAAAWAVRRVRVEGRSLARAGLGRVALWCAPHSGAAAGRAQRPRRPVFLPSVRMFVAPGDWKQR